LRLEGWEAGKQLSSLASMLTRIKNAPPYLNPISHQPALKVPARNPQQVSILPRFYQSEMRNRKARNPQA